MASLSDAYLLFRKWETESALITILLRFPEGGAACVGFISALSSDFMVVSAPNFNNEPSGNNIYMNLDEIETVDYADSRTIPSRIVRSVIAHILEIRMKSGHAITIY